MLQFRFAPALIGLASLVAMQAAQATNGYMSHAYSPAAKGMAGAGEAALPQDSLSIVGNPAGLVRIGNRLDIGAAWFSPSREYSGIAPFNADGTQTGASAPIGGGNGTGTVESENNDFLIPNFGVSYQLDDLSAVGFALFGNGGMNTDWRSRDTLFNLGTYGGNNGCANPPAVIPSTDPQNPCGGTAIPGMPKLGAGNAGVNFEQLGLAFAYSRKLADNFTLGASLLLGYQTIEVRGVGGFQAFTQTFTQTALAGRPTSPSALTDNGDDSALGYGFQIGALWDINPEVTLGASIRSKVYMEEFEEYKDLFAEGGDFDIPAVGSIGLAWRPDDRLSVALDVQQIWYGDVPALANTNELDQYCNLRNPGAYQASKCLGGDDGAGFGWRDMTVVKLGVQYAVNDTLTVRAGYSHGNQPISGKEVAFNALAPAVIEDHITLGATYRLQKNYELTFWGMYAPEETVEGPGAFTGTQAPEITMSQYELGINFGLLFN